MKISALQSEFNAFFDAWILANVGIQNAVLVAQHAEAARMQRLDHHRADREFYAALGKGLDANAAVVSAPTLAGIAEERLDIAPLGPFAPTGGDFIYAKINHGFWEQLYLLFGTSDPGKMRPADGAYYHKSYVESAFVPALNAVMRATLQSDALTVQAHDPLLAISLSGGAVDHRTVLANLRTTPDDRVMIGAAIGLLSYFDTLFGPSRRLALADGAFPKAGYVSGALRESLEAFSRESAWISFVAPPHLEGIRYTGIPAAAQERIHISPTHIHETWLPALYWSTLHILERVADKGAVMVIAQCAVFSALLGGFLSVSKKALLGDRGRVYFFDLGQVLDIANPTEAGPWLLANAVNGDKLFECEV